MFYSQPLRAFPVTISWYKNIFWATMPRRNLSPINFVKRYICGTGTEIWSVVQIPNYRTLITDPMGDIVDQTWLRGNHHTFFAYSQDPTRGMYAPIDSKIPLKTT
jgi:hypothetical protein